MLLFLVYHRVLAKHDGDFHTITTQEFSDQLRIVQQSSLPILDPHLLSADHEWPSRGVILTFDDGTEDHSLTIQPILDQNGIKGMFYVPTSYLNQPGYLSTQQLIQLWDGGHMIGSHSHTHPQLPSLSLESLKEELHRSSILLQEILGEAPLHFAPPGGLYNGQVQEAAKNEGYRFFRTMDWGYNRSFDPIRMEVVPLFHGPSQLMLKAGLAGTGEPVLKTLFHLKNGLRKTGKGGIYQGLRRTLARFSDN